MRTDRIGRKVQTSTEAWGTIFATTSEREKFMDVRLEPTIHAGSRLTANNTQEQAPVGPDGSGRASCLRAAKTRGTSLLTDEVPVVTAVSHAHRLPDSSHGPLAEGPPGR